MNREELILSIRRLLEECAEKDAMLEISSAASTEMSVQYQKIKEENTALKKKNQELLRQNRNLTDQHQMRTRDLFGRSSEMSSGIADAVMDGSLEDPLSEDPSEPGQETTLSASELDKALNPGRTRSHKARKKAGKRKSDLEGLPTKTCYKLDIEKYNRIYGEGRWRIAFWRREDTVESIHISKYHKCLFHPVISVGLEHELVCPDPCGKLLPGSLASPSLVSELMYQKACLCLPSYRMEADLRRSGVPLSRQTITNWINRFSYDYLATAADYMASLLVRKRYNQCDETTYEVIRDGRKAGAKGYVWVHTTSELDQGHPLIVYRFELTRSTDHLRRFYGDTGYKGCITSDAYCSYDTLAKEYPDIYGSGCLMHVRRRFYQASLLIKAAGKPSEAFRDLPEMKALMMIDEINEAEQPLKSVSPEERLRIRQSLVKGRVDAFYSYIKTLDAGDP
ncbi:MAG: IS66 family transposase, partial [Lachnospiraceae bacterium]|nr:IS66 family transposase [Lachnospiraceae bacterium]